MEINKNELSWIVHSLDTAYCQALGNNDTQAMRNYEEIYAKMSHLLGRMFREEMDTVSIETLPKGQPEGKNVIIGGQSAYQVGGFISWD